MLEEKCHICGKAFVIPPKNIYKIVIEGRVTHLCSWKCLRVAEREKEAQKEARKADKRKPKER